MLLDLIYMVFDNSNSLFGYSVRFATGQMHAMQEHQAEMYCCRGLSSMGVKTTTCCQVLRAPQLRAVAS